MIRTLADLKHLFRNGAVPRQGDFADLIDSFMPRDALSDSDLAALREVAAWWRARPDAGPAVPAVPPPVPEPLPPPPIIPIVPLAGPGPVTVAVPADGAWSWLPVNAAQEGSWSCTAAYLPRLGFAVKGDAIAFVQDGTRQLVQNIRPPRLRPSRTLQFAWRLKDGSGDYWLALRSGCAFGAGATIECTVMREAPDA